MRSLFSWPAERSPVGSFLAPLRSPAATAAKPTFGDVYEEHFDFVWRSVRRLGVPEAGVDDAVQDVFLVVHRRLTEFEGRSSLKTWLFQIVLRVAARHRRTRQRKAPETTDSASVPPDDLVDPHENGPHERAARAEEIRLLYDLLEHLDDDKRAVFVLADLEQLSAPEIAETLGVKLNTVYSRLRTARQIVEQAAARLQCPAKGNTP